jgi:hypothetical protein
MERQRPQDRLDDLGCYRVGVHGEAALAGTPTPDGQQAVGCIGGQHCIANGGTIDSTEFLGDADEINLTSRSAAASTWYRVDSERSEDDGTDNGHDGRDAHRDRLAVR